VISLSVLDRLSREAHVLLDQDHVMVNHGHAVALK
jgi:hypothetical protein